MAEFMPNIATFVVLAIVVACVVLSIRLMHRKGMCGEKELCSSCGSGSCAGCSACADVDRMIADADARLAGVK